MIAISHDGRRVWGSTFWAWRIRFHSRAFSDEQWARTSKLTKASEKNGLLMEMSGLCGVISGFRSSYGPRRHAWALMALGDRIS